MSFFLNPHRFNEYIVIWAIGDSHMTKRNPDFTTYGPTPPNGTVYQWDVANSNLYTVGATDIKQTGAGTDWGSIFPQTGISINAVTGKKIVFVTCGTGGTNYSPRTGDSGNWSTGGTLYAAAKTTMDNCLTYMGKTTPDYVLVNLGVNDERGATSMTTIKSDCTSLNDRIHTDYPNATIIQVMFGRDNVSFNNQRATDLRNYIKSEVSARSYMYLCASETGLAGAGYYDSDGIHLSQPGNNEVGKMIGQWFANSAYSDKMSRAVISSHLAGTLNSTNKALVDAWFTTMGSSYAETEAYYNFRTSTGNHYLDWTLQYCGGNTGGATITANDCITTNGTSTYWTVDININIALKMTTTDNYMGVKVKTNRSGAGTGVRNAFGASVSGAGWLIGQNNTPNVYYRDCDLTTSTNAATAVPSDSFLSVQRNGTSKQYAVNGTVTSSATVASTGGINQPVYIGCSNSTGSAAAFIDADFGYAIFGKLSTSTMANVYSACENVYDNWTP